MFYASGNVVFQQQGTRISAERAEINGKTHEAAFFNAWGVLQLNDAKADRSLFGGQEPDATFRGEDPADRDRVQIKTNGNHDPAADAPLGDVTRRSSWCRTITRS
jgi:hypothetical protein